MNKPITAKNRKRVPVEIQQNLDHTDLKTTLGYIGTLDADQRRPPAVYSFDLSRLHQ